MTKPELEARLIATAVAKMNAAQLAALIQIVPTLEGYDKQNWDTLVKELSQGYE